MDIVLIIKISENIKVKIKIVCKKVENKLNRFCKELDVV